MKSTRLAVSAEVVLGLILLFGIGSFTLFHKYLAFQQDIVYLKDQLSQTTRAQEHLETIHKQTRASLQHCEASLAASTSKSASINDDLASTVSTSRDQPPMQEVSGFYCVFEVFCVFFVRMYLCFVLCNVVCPFYKQSASTLTKKDLATTTVSTITDQMLICIVNNS
jgi:hypothetical protein